MDLITIQRIKQAHPEMRKELLEHYKAANNLLGKYERLRFSYVYRSPKLQDQLFKQRPKVTNAMGWQSIHNYGLAFDICLLIDKDKNGTFETLTYDMISDFDLDKTPDWSEITKFFLSKGYTNGFISNGEKWDFPHFQKDFGYNWKSLKQLVDKKITIEDHGIIYPRI